MKTFSHSIWAVIFLFATANISFSQSLLWKHVSDEQSDGTAFIENPDGEYILSSYSNGIATNNLLSNDGVLLSSSVICHCARGIVFATRLSDNRILYISTNGRIFVADNSGRRIEELERLSFDPMITQGKRNRNFVTLVGFANDPYESSGTKHIFDLISLEVVYERKFTGIDPPVSLDYFDDQSSVELHETYGSDSARLVKKLANDSIIFDIYFDSENIHFSGITATYSGETFAIGRGNDPDDFFPLSGILVKFAQDGKELWRQTYISSTNSKYGILVFNKIRQAPDNSITIVGSDGIVETFQPVYILNLTTDGEVNWELLEQIHWDGERPVDFMYTGHNELVIAGTSGLTDYLGPERAFVAKFSILPTAVENLNSTALNVYPNPFNSSFNIYGLEHSYDYWITDVNGVTIGSGITDGVINTEDLSRGFYFLRIHGFSTTKIVKL